MPNIEEPFESYLNSDSYRKSFKRITFSTVEDQDQSMRRFSASLTASQRMEYLYQLNKIFFAEHIKKLPGRFTGKLYFDPPR